jgi:hypothetical protein
MDNKIFIHDVTTGKSFERDLTADEIAQAELDKQTERQSNEVTPTVG